MKSAMSLAIVLGFLIVDALMFHDILKPGESYTPVEHLTGIVSVAAILLLTTDLLIRFKVLAHR